VIAINRFSFLVCLAASIPVAQSAADQVAGDLIVFNDNGAWSWFEGERVIFDSNRGKLLLSSVANSHGPHGVSRSGDVDVVSYDLSSRTTQRLTLSNNLQEDDHDSAALLILPDGRYLASYSKHARDNCLRYRISVRPGDITAWQPEEIFLSAGSTTYSNLYYLSKSNTIFDFHRDGGRGFDPNYLRWDLGSASGFAYGGHLLTGPEGNTGNNDRPYLRYASNGIDRIHFITTDHHPRNLVANGIYHGYIQCERDGYGVYRSDGTRLGDLSTRTTSPYKASDFTQLFVGAAKSPVNGLRMMRGWTTDIELDNSGYPYIAFTARVNDSDADHRFFYGRYSRSGWSIHELAMAGGCLYSPENDYTGLAALDPNDPDHVYISTNVDPRIHRALPHYEIFDGRTVDGGTSWNWSPITYESSVDNLRPVVPRGAQKSTVLLWMRGKYNSYTNYNSRIVGLLTLDPTAKIAVASNPKR
jgi:hypothetical protein